MASHDMNIASEFCDRLILLQKGRIFKIGTPSEVITRRISKGSTGATSASIRIPFQGCPDHPYKKEPPREEVR